jgi:predicted DNA-binding transcriptional regulator AlpA/ribosomal protein L13E
MTTPHRALRMPAVKAKTSMGRTQILDAVKRGVFPAPFKVLPGGKAIAWDEAEVDQHLERQMAARDLKLRECLEQHRATSPKKWAAARAARTSPCKVLPGRKGIVRDLAEVHQHLKRQRAARGLELGECREQALRHIDVEVDGRWRTSNRSYAPARSGSHARLDFNRVPIGVPLLEAR